jgi:hypothetical protein
VWEIDNCKEVCDRTKMNEKEYNEKEGIRENTDVSSDSDSSGNDTTELSENSDLSGV